MRSSSTATERCWRSALKYQTRVGGQTGGVPEDVVGAVAVEVADDRDVRAADRQGLLGAPARAEPPDPVGRRAGAVPEDVVEAVAVEVTDRRPVGAGDRRRPPWRTRRTRSARHCTSAPPPGRYSNGSVSSSPVTSGPSSSGTRARLGSSAPAAATRVRRAGRRAIRFVPGQLVACTSPWPTTAAQRDGGAAAYLAEPALVKGTVERGSTRWSANFHAITRAIDSNIDGVTPAVR